MQILFYLKQWPGTKWKRVIRFFHHILLELNRIFNTTKFIAEFVVTDECNLRCKHCYFYKDENLRSTNNLPIESWEEKFKEQFKLGIRSVLLIGGEPTLRIDIILLAQKIFPYVNVCTNGLIKLPKEYKNSISLSLDGNKEIHDSIRGSNVYEQAISNYIDDKGIFVGMTITNDNYAAIEDLLQITVRNNLIGVGFDIYSSKKGELDNMYIKPETRTEIINILRSFKKKYSKHFLLSKKSIKWYETIDHSKDKCYWRTEVRHFNSSLEETKTCEHYDCSNCGCFCGANGANINFILRWEEKLKRLNPFRTSKQS